MGKLIIETKDVQGFIEKTSLQKIMKYEKQDKIKTLHAKIKRILIIFASMQVTKKQEKKLLDMFKEFTEELKKYE